MAKIRIVGDSSGYVELSAPNAAGNNTLELPSNATKLVGADASNSLNVTGIATFSGGIVGNVTGNVNSTGVSTFSNGITIGTGASISSPATNVLALGTNNSERVRIDSSGRLGIGTLTPQTTLDVGGTIRNTPDKSSYIQVGRFSSAYGGAALSTAGGSTFLSLQVEGFEGVKIDSAGRVTMPYQPHAEGGINSGASNTAPTTSEIIRFNRADVNVGNHYDTSQYRFNCPVTGNYLVKAHAQSSGQTATTSNTVNFNIRKNGASISGVYESRYYGGTAPGYVKLEIIDVVYATAGDYLDIYAIISGTSLSLEYNAADIRWRFSYTLLG